MTHMLHNSSIHGTALQAQNTAWMGSTWDKLNGETVEKQVTTAYKTLYKMNKVSLF